MTTTVSKVRVTDLMKILAEMLYKKHYFVDVEAINTDDTPNTLRVFPTLSPIKKEEETPLDDETIAQLM